MASKFSKILKRSKHLIHKIFKHRLLAVLFVVILGIGGYLSYQKIFNRNNTTRYLLAQVKKGELIVSVEGTGNISASNQIDIKAKVGGEVIAVYPKVGQEVKEGYLLVTIDPENAQRAVRDAETALESAKLELEKLLKPPDELTLLQAENALKQAEEAKQKAEDNLQKAYEDGFNAVSNAFLDLPGIMTGLDDILYKKTIDPRQNNIDWYLNQGNYLIGDRDKVGKYYDDVNNFYNQARTAYDHNFDFYKSTSRNSDKAIIENLILETYETTKLISDTIKSANNLIDLVQDAMKQKDMPIPSLITTHKTNLTTYTSKINTHLSNLLLIKRSIEDSKDALVNAERSIEERRLYLEKLKKGPDELDIRARQLAIQQKENALTTAKENLSNCYIRAPFTGIVAKVNVKKGDTISAGTPVVTLVSKQKIAEISLNEVDVAQVKVGQKANLTFDAIPDLTLTGQVIEVDLVGTISQGVVSYTVKIGFDTDDPRIKPGMSVTASIITNSKKDVLLVPNSAIKSQGNINYVEIPNEKDFNLIVSLNKRLITLNNPPRRRSVKIGASNENFTEIIEGLSEGDYVIVQTIKPNTNQSQLNQSNIRIPGFTGGGGGFRMR